MGWVVFAGVRKKKHKNGVVASFRAVLGEFWGDFVCVLWVFFALLEAAAGKHIGFSFFLGPVGCWAPQAEKLYGRGFLGAILQLFIAVPGPNHMHGTAATHVGSGLPRLKRVPPLPWWWSHSNPNPPT